MISEPDIEVFYDGGCPVCRWEVDLYARIDTSDKIRWTDIEGLAENNLPREKTREDLLGKFHVRELNTHSGDWFVGIDAFARIWKALPIFRYFAFLFRLPIIRQMTMLAYMFFLRWQRRHRAKRALSGR